MGWGEQGNFWPPRSRAGTPCSYILRKYLRVNVNRDFLEPVQTLRNKIKQAVCCIDENALKNFYRTMRFRSWPVLQEQSEYFLHLKNKNLSGYCRIYSSAIISKKRLEYDKYIAPLAILQHIVRIRKARFHLSKSSRLLPSRNHSPNCRFMICMLNTLYSTSIVFDLISISLLHRLLRLFFSHLWKVLKEQDFQTLH